jgi:hypothetical protein
MARRMAPNVEETGPLLLSAAREVSGEIDAVSVYV